jgi:hypothetical protein
VSPGFLRARGKRPMDMPRRQITVKSSGQMHAADHGFAQHDGSSSGISSRHRARNAEINLLALVASIIT